MFNITDESILVDVGIRLIDALQSRGILEKKTDIGRYQMCIDHDTSAIYRIDTITGDIDMVRRNEISR